MDALWWALVGIFAVLMVPTFMLGTKYEKYRKEMLKTTPKYKIAAWMIAGLLHGFTVLAVTYCVMPEMLRYGAAIAFIGVWLFLMAFYLLFLRPFHKKSECLCKEKVSLN